MKITTVSYQRTYNLGSYNSEKIGLEADIEEGEDIQFVVCNLKHECDQIHQKNNPHLYQEQGQYYNTPQSIKEETGIERVYSNSGDPFIGKNYPQNESGLHPSNSPTFQAPQPQKLSQQELIESEIQRADTPQKLKEWELLSNKFPQTKELYQNKLNQLTND